MTAHACTRLCANCVCTQCISDWIFVIGLVLVFVYVCVCVCMYDTLQYIKSAAPRMGGHRAHHYDGGRV